MKLNPNLKLNRNDEIQRLYTAVDCFIIGLNAKQIARLHKAMMYKGRNLDLLNLIVGCK